MEDLLHLARTMMVRAYAPYSKFPVGAAVRDEDGGVHGGCRCLGRPWTSQQRSPSPTMRVQVDREPLLRGCSCCTPPRPRTHARTLCPSFTRIE